MSVHVCGPCDMHPYECPGPRGGCVHCLRIETPDHDPRVCVLCESTDPTHGRVEPEPA